jgi:endonuclease YncB( thermonuclease family)
MITVFFPERGRPMFLFLVLLCLFLIPPVAGRCDEPFKVETVYSGDMIRVEGAGTKLRVRLVVVDAPVVSPGVGELGQPHSLDARNYLSGLILDKVVRIRSYGYLGYDLLLGEIFCEDKNINLEMLRAGWAEIHRGERPQDLDLQPYLQAEQESKAARRGIWGPVERHISPAEWRRQKGNKTAIGVLLYGLEQEQHQ